MNEEPPSLPPKSPSPDGSESQNPFESSFHGSDFPEPPPARNRPQYPEPPLDDPFYEGGFASAVLETIKRSLFQPMAFFAGIREDRSPMPSIILAILVICLGSYINLLITTLLGINPLRDMMEMMGEIDPNLDLEAFADFQTVGLAVNLVLVPIMAVLQVFISILIYYVCTLIWQSYEGSFSCFMRLYAYSLLPAVFNLFPLQWIPGIGWVYGLCIYVYQLVLLGVGLYQMGEDSKGRVVGTVLTPLVFCCLCILGCFAFAVLSLSMGSGA